ncbi:MAG: hypothetical protein ABI724_15995 [Betaproteobacteria bacterium]
MDYRIDRRRRGEMNRRIGTLASIVLAASLGAAPSRAADDVTQAKDLTSVIALLGLPCGQVKSVVRLGENDNVATCENGMRYRVFINAEGRVVAQKQ